MAYSSELSQDPDDYENKRIVYHCPWCQGGSGDEVGLRAAGVQGRGEAPGGVGGLRDSLAHHPCGHHYHDRRDHHDRHEDYYLTLVLRSLL